MNIKYQSIKAKKQNQDEKIVHFIYEQDIWTNKKGKNIERKRAIKFDCKQRVWCVCVVGLFI